MGPSSRATRMDTGSGTDVGSAVAASGATLQSAQASHATTLRRGLLSYSSTPALIHLRVLGPVRISSSPAWSYCSAAVVLDKALVDDEADVRGQVESARVRGCEGAAAVLMHFGDENGQSRPFPLGDTGIVL